MAVKYTNPLSENLHARKIERPDSFKSCDAKWHPVAGAVAKLASLLCQYKHRWNKTEKKLYRRAINSVKTPICPHCFDPLESAKVTREDGLRWAVWFCENCQTFDL